MTKSATPDTTRFSTLWGGGLVAVSGLLLVLWGFLWGPFEAGLVTLRAGAIVVAPILLVVALLILGFGVRGDAGIMGRSRVGRGAAVAFATVTLGSWLLTLFGPNDPTALPGLPQFTFPILTNLVLMGISVGSLIIIALTIIRTGVVHRFSGWGLLVVVLLTEGPSLLAFLPWPGLDQAGLTVGFEIAYWIYLAGLLLQIVVGIGIAVTGQASMLRHAAKVFNDRW
jgi:hypothetical protein